MKLILDAGGVIVYPAFGSWLYGAAMTENPVVADTLGGEAFQRAHEACWEIVREDARMDTEAEEYARQKGYRNLKYVIGSTGMSCHGRPITDFAEELRTLRSNGRAHFDFFRKIGFVPAGFIPNCYGENYHGIIMIKSLL